MAAAIACPHCGYLRQQVEGSPESQCPKCGVVYEKSRLAERAKFIQSAHQKAIESARREAQEVRAFRMSILEGVLIWLSLISVLFGLSLCIALLFVLSGKAEFKSLFVPIEIARVAVVFVVVTLPGVIVAMLLPYKVSEDGIAYKGRTCFWGYITGAAIKRIFFQKMVVLDEETPPFAIEYTMAVRPDFQEAVKHFAGEDHPLTKYLLSLK